MDEYKDALQAYKVANKKRDDLKEELEKAEKERTEAFYKYKNEAIKADKW